MDQDDGDVDLQATEQQANRSYHQCPGGDASASGLELQAGSWLLPAGGECQANSCEDGEQGRRPSGERQAHPGWCLLKVAFEYSHQMGGHHAEECEAACRVNAR
jgi:hypothetical protein